jgi:secreted Zn-dependent insulinase-like peptidase
LPKPNEFIATEFDIKHPQFSEEEIEAKKDYSPLRIPVEELDGPAASKGSQPAAATVAEGEQKQEQQQPVAVAAASVAANGSAAPSGFIPLSEHPLSSVWWKADRTFGLPKSNLLLRFRTPRVYDSPSSSLLANLYAQLVSDALNEFAYHAQIASLNYKSVGHTTPLPSSPSSFLIFVSP